MLPCCTTVSRICRSRSLSRLPMRSTHCMPEPCRNGYVILRYQNWTDMSSRRMLMNARGGWRFAMPVLSRALPFAVLLSALLACTVAYADDYPSRPVKVVVPFPAGGPSDFTARLLADKLAASLKQPFIVENRPGASGNIGTDAVAKSEPDGYTLLLAPETPLTVNPGLYPKLPFDPVNDLATIS